MPSKYCMNLVWNVKEAEELERLLGDTDIKSVNIKFKAFILKGLRVQIGTENPGITELKYCIWKPNKITVQ